MRTHFLLRKGFPFFKKFNNALSRIVESGLVPYWLHESQVNIEKISIPDYEDIEGYLDLERILSAFILLGVGYLASIFVFLLELLNVKTKAIKNFNFQVIIKNPSNTQ